MDIMCLSETKIDVSFPIAQFNIPGFKCHRADRNEHGGGIMAYVRNDLSHRSRSDLEHSTHTPVESLIFEIAIRKEKWPFICLYNPHNKYKKQCCNSIETFYDAVQAEHITTAFVIGDMTINMMNDRDSLWLCNTMETHGLTNIVNDPTCFKADNPSLIDMILTNKPRRVADTLNAGTGLSDFHNMTCLSTKICVPRKSKNFITCRSYYHFDMDAFKKDISAAPYHIGEIFDDFDDRFLFTSKLMKSVADIHAPRKIRRPVDQPVPFMNVRLRKACHNKAMARN